jgi:hypothetical protein
MWNFDEPMRADRSTTARDRNWLDVAALDAARERLEAGPGGDVDEGERLTRAGLCYVPGLKRTVSAWLRLSERVQQGELGGPEDGLLRLGRLDGAA